MTTLPIDPDRPLVDVRDMFVVHTAMLREFRLAPAAIRRTAPTDRRRVRAVDDHLSLVGDLLHHHHQGEDELLWPRVLERTGPEAHAAIEEAEGQHEAIDASLSRVEALRRAWATDPSETHRDALAEELERLHLVLGAHLDFEERRLLPIVAAVLTEAEWLSVGDAGAASVPKPALALVFGMFAYEGDPAVIAQMLAAAPAPVRVLMPRIAPLVYARRCRLIHGTSRP